MEQGVGPHEGVLGAGARAFIERPEVDEPLGRGIGGEGGEKPVPFLPGSRVQRNRIALGGKGRSAVDGAAAGAGGAEAGDQRAGEVGSVGEDDPRWVEVGSRFRGRGGRGAVLAGEHADLAFAFRAVEAGQGGGFGEADLAEHGFPLGALEERLFRAQVVVGEVPPAAGQAEDRFRPQLRGGDVHEHEGAAGGEQFMERAQGGADVGHGVEHVGADDEVAGPGLEALGGEGFFEVEDLEIDLGEGGELLAGGGEEAGRDIGEGVLVQAAIEEREELCGEAAGTGADFEQAQAATFGQVAGGFPDRTGDAGHPVAGEEAVAVEMLQQFGPGPAEEDLDRVLLPAEDGPEFGAGGGTEQAFREVAGVAVDEIAESGLGGGGGFGEGGRGKESAVAGGEQPAGGEPVHEPSEDRAHGGGDAERVRGEDGGGGHAHRLQAVGDLGGGEVVLGGHDGFEVGAAAQGDDGVESGLGGVAQAVERHRGRRCGRGHGVSAFPVDVVHQVATAAGGTGPAGGRQADGAEAIDEHARAAGVVIEGDAAFEQFLVEVEDAGVDAG